MSNDPVPTGSAKLILPHGRTIELPYLTDAAGNGFVDIRRLHPETGVCTYDPGFTSTASCKSSITFTDGTKGVLRYRGYELETLAETKRFSECAALLLFGELPSEKERDEFESDLRKYSLLHEQLIHFYKGFKHDAHPMAILVGVVGALSAFYHDGVDLKDPAERRKTALRLIAKMPTIASIAYKTAIGQPIIYPRNDLSYAENLLHMMFATPCGKYDVDPFLARALEIIFILHMDHEQNASTSTVRTAGSSQANPYACIASGIATLWGPAHGGANEAALRMLMDIGTVENIPKVIERAKDKKDPFRLMGFGHRVYKTHDPRSVVLKKLCHQVLEHKGHGNDPILQVGVRILYGLVSRGDDLAGRVGVRKGRSRRSVLHQSTSLPQSRFLFRHRLACHWHSDFYVYRFVCRGAQRWLDFAVDGNGRRGHPTHHTSTSVLQGPHRTTPEIFIQASIARRRHHHRPNHWGGRSENAISCCSWVVIVTMGGDLSLFNGSFDKTLYIAWRFALSVSFTASMQ